LQEFGCGKIIRQKSASEFLNGITKSLSNGLKLYVTIRDYKTAADIRFRDEELYPILKFS
jgi:hypothetical protein